MAAIGYLWFKDGLSGQSIGKRFMGVQVINERTGLPGGFIASLKRNLFLFIPIYPLFVGLALVTGKRPGDGWARTKVIWLRYADQEIFKPHCDREASVSVSEEVIRIGKESGVGDEYLSVSTPLPSRISWRRSKFALACSALVAIAAVWVYFGQASELPHPAQTGIATSNPESVSSLVDRARPSIVTVIAYDSAGSALAQGTGFILAPDQIVTSNHVIANAAQITLKLATGQLLADVVVLASDSKRDLAVLHCSLPRRGVSPVPVAIDKTRVGDRIIVIGSPLGLEQSVSDGIVSAWRDMGERGVVMQITAPISPGSSGSPVLNMKGEVVAVVRSKLTGGENMNVAVAINELLSSQVQSYVGGQYGDTHGDSHLPQVKPGATAGRKRFAKIYDESIHIIRDCYGPTWSQLSDLEKAQSLLVDMGLSLASWKIGVVCCVIAERAVNNEPNNPEAWFVYGKALALSGIEYHDSYIEAVVAFQNAHRLDPSRADVLLELAESYGWRAYHERDNEMSRLSLSAALRAVDLLPEFAKAHEFLGHHYASGGQTWRAIRHFELAVHNAPYESASYGALAQQYINAGRWKNAIETCERMIDSGNIHTVECVYMMLGTSLLKIGRVQDAIDAFRVGANRDRFFNGYRNHIALIDALARSGQRDEAEIEIQRLLADAMVDERDAWAEAYGHYYAALLRLSQGRQREARAHWRELKQLAERSGALRARELFNTLTQEFGGDW